jgi:hypothetical protein
MAYWTKAQRLRNERRVKRQEALRHYHVCEFCPDDRRYVCYRARCGHKEKKLCSACRYRKKHHRVKPDIFESVAAAALAIAIEKMKSGGRVRVAVHMESSFEFGEVVHRYWSHWSDGTTTEMTNEDVKLWRAELKAAEQSEWA